MAIHKLSARKVETAQAGKYEDGGGLRLVVSANGSKRWVLRFTIDGKRREKGLGPYPVVTLEAAREHALECRRQVYAGQDPIENRKEKDSRTPTFRECAIAYIESNKHAWTNKKHADQWSNSLTTYAFPVIGNKSVTNINVDHILKVLEPIWYEKNETAKRVQTRVAKILDYAIARKYRSSSNPAKWQGHLDTILPKPTSIQKRKHHPAMPLGEVSNFWKILSSKQATSANALQLLILTATRTSEVLKATWDEIDLDEGIWVIPKERMKTKKEHRVPLSKQAIRLLGELPKIEGSNYLFPGNRKGSALSNMAMLTLMRKMGYESGSEKGDYVPHGFRSTFRDWAGEVSNYPRDVVEMALAHTIDNKVEAAYRRGDMFKKRAEMMQDWADFFTPTNKSNQL
ncbi:tyrosine-type recombinase/integrase [Bacterioplanoides sp.]|uniref:tyrosine-type recombinase/integrase n=1 Tax=Bacterioplanoides sp. TaxID=2066072 RepID=UPI003B5A94AE